MRDDIEESQGQYIETQQLNMQEVAKLPVLQRVLTIAEVIVNMIKQKRESVHTFSILN